MNADPKPRRHWYQYSLRSLFVVMFLACIGMSWLATKLKRISEQREVVNTIVASGGEVVLDSDHSKDGWRTFRWGEPPRLGWFDKVIAVEYCGNPRGMGARAPRFNPELLGSLTELDSVERLFLASYRIQDEHLAEVARFKKLRSLRIEDAPISGKGLGFLAAMPNLEELDLDNCRLSASDLLQFTTFPRLRRLSVTSMYLGHCDGELAILRDSRPGLDVQVAAFTLGTGGDPDTRTNRHPTTAAKPGYAGTPSASAITTARLRESYREAGMCEPFGPRFCE